MILLVGAFEAFDDDTAKQAGSQDQLGGLTTTTTARTQPYKTAQLASFMNTIVQKQLGPGETLRVDTGCIVAFQPTVQFDIQFVGKIKTALFGGEGLFFATLRGPGHVWLQSLPFSRLEIGRAHV